MHQARPLVFLLLLAAFFCPFLSAERVEDLPQPTDYVSDFAHVLSTGAIERVDQICSQLDHSQANAQIAVVTVHTLEGMDSADYANALEDRWKMGRKGQDYRGVLILLAVDDHKRRIDVGYGLEGILPDAKVGDIGREMVPYLRQNDFNSAVLLAVGELGQVIATDAKVTLQDEPVAPAPRQVRSGIPAGKLILLALVLLFFGGFHLLRFLFGWGLFSSLFGRGPWIGGGGFGGGGFGGGGDSGGGGFGGFGGGGGGFGGGGAGGDW